MAVTINGTTGIDTPSLTADTTTLVVDETNNRVGIGTASPTNTFHVDGTLKVEGSVGTISTDSQGLTLDLNRAGTTGVVNNNASGILTFGTATSERMRIDASGRVTMPNQPRFSAYWHDGAALRASPATMKFNSVDVNVGNHYNSSTYLFTAPIAGDYFFTFSVNSNGSGQFYNYFIKNGTQVPAGQSYTNDNATYKMGNSSLIITLQANDTMGVYLHNGSDYQNSYQNTFCGYLIG